MLEDCKVRKDSKDPKVSKDGHEYNKHEYKSKNKHLGCMHRHFMYATTRRAVHLGLATHRLCG